MKVLGRCGVVNPIQTLLARNPGNHVTFSDLNAISHLLEVLWKIGAARQVQKVIARDPVNQVRLDDREGVAHFMEVLGKVQAVEQVQTMAERLVRLVEVHDPFDVAWTLRTLGRSGAIQQAQTLLSCDPANKVELYAPDGVAWLLEVLGELDAVEQMQTLAMRVGTHFEFDHSDVVRLSRELTLLGAAALRELFTDPSGTDMSDIANCWCDFHFNTDTTGTDKESWFWLDLT